MVRAIFDGAGVGGILAQPAQGRGAEYRAAQSSMLPAGVFPVELSEGLSAVTEKLAAGSSLSPRELLLFQIRASELHLRVELLSKAAESLLASLRKLQSSQ